MIEWVIAGVCAGVVSVGIIAVAKAIMTGLVMSRRPSHHLAEQTGVKPVPPEGQIPTETTLWGR